MLEAQILVLARDGTFSISRSLLVMCRRTTPTLLEVRAASGRKTACATRGPIFPPLRIKWSSLVRSEGRFDPSRKEDNKVAIVVAGCLVKSGPLLLQAPCCLVSHLSTYTSQCLVETNKEIVFGKIIVASNTHSIHSGSLLYQQYVV